MGRSVDMTGGRRIGQAAGLATGKDKYPAIGSSKGVDIDSDTQDAMYRCGNQ